MHYWRKQIFEKLTEIADSISSNKSWADYYLYLVNKEKGLKNKALNHLNRFIKSMNDSPIEDRIEFVDWLNTIDHFNGFDIHGHFPQPLRQQLTRPTIDEWLKIEPNSSVAHRWNGTDESLAKSIELDPNEQIARFKIVRNCINHVSMSQQELHTGYGYIGDPIADLDRINFCIGYVDGLNREDKDLFAKTLIGLKTVAEEYLKYRDSNQNEKSFLIWLNKNNPKTVQLL